MRLSAEAMMELQQLIAEGNKKSKSIMDRQRVASEAARKVLGYPGRMMSGSKSGYHHLFPRNIAVFNSNVCTEKGKIWYGDLDITEDEEKLKNLAKLLGTKLYVLYESDGRFDNEESPKVERAIYSTDGDNFTIGRGETDYYERATRGKLKGKLVLKKEHAWDMSHLYGRKRKKR